MTRIQIHAKLAVKDIIDDLIGRSGIDDQVHCIFCQLSFLTKRAADDMMLWWRQNETTHWPEGSEI
jgi:hypothetical protein